MNEPLYALRAGLAAADAGTKDNALTVASGQGAGGKHKNANADFRCDGIAEQAAQTIAGELVARSYLDRLRDGTAQPGELSAMLCYLRGELLHSACWLIEKALEGRSHA